MYKAYFWFECIAHFCSIFTFVIIYAHIIITAIRIDRKREAKRELTEWLKEEDNDNNEQADSRSPESN